MFVWSLLACAEGPCSWAQSLGGDDVCTPKPEAHEGSAPTFPLEGAHLVVSCDSCHGSGTPDADVPTTCVGCHADEVPEVHWSGDCETCHVAEDWAEVSWDSGDTG